MTEHITEEALDKAMSGMAVGPVESFQESRKEEDVTSGRPPRPALPERPSTVSFRESGENRNSHGEIHHAESLESRQSEDLQPHRNRITIPERKTVASAIANVNESEEDCFEFACKGQPLLKKGNSMTPVSRFLVVDPKSCEVWVCPDTTTKELIKKVESSIPIIAIREIRYGSSAKHFANNNIPLYEGRCFTIVYGRTSQMLSFICGCEGDALLWLKAFDFITSQRYHIDRTRCWINKQWLIYSKVSAKSKPGVREMKSKAVVEWMGKINCRMDKISIESFVAKTSSDIRSDRLSNEDDLEKFFQSIIVHEWEKNLFYKVSEQKHYINVQQFLRFATLEQKDFFMVEDKAREIFASYGYTEGLNLNGFIKYLQSRDNDIFNPIHRSVYQDMSQPLSHYYLASSHNTYLTGDQLSSQSSVEMYIAALKKGCRCVELDCWDGEVEPVIYHGRTLTSKIAFRDVIVAIRDYAFEASPYPLILSLENHCSLMQQEKQVQLMVDILGESLYVPPVDKTKQNLPSPEDLKYRILIKNKTLSFGDFVDKDESEDVGEDKWGAKGEGEARGSFEDGSQNGSSPSQGPGTSSGVNVYKSNSVQLPAAPATSSLQKQQTFYSASSSSAKSKTGKIKISPQLSSMVNYCTPVPFRGFRTSYDDPDITRRPKYWELCSLNETKALKMCKRSGGDFSKHNRYHITRIYPSGLRVDSSNFDPFPFWNSGCQLVSLNYQTYDEAMQYEEAKFVANGKCGYILKPGCLRGESHFDPNMPKQIAFAVDSRFDKQYMLITVLSAQLLPKPGAKLKAKNILSGKEKAKSIWQKLSDPYIKVYPFVKVSVKGLQCDTNLSETAYVNDNSFNPTWNERFEFFVSAPELAIVRFEIHYKDVGIVGHYTIPFESIRPGYRYLWLLSPNGDDKNVSALFVHIKIQSYGAYIRALEERKLKQTGPVAAVSTQSSNGGLIQRDSSFANGVRRELKEMISPGSGLRQQQQVVGPPYQPQPGTQYPQQPGFRYQQQPGVQYQQQPGSQYAQQPGVQYQQQPGSQFRTPGNAPYQGGVAPPAGYSNPYSSPPYPQGYSSDGKVPPRDTHVPGSQEERDALYAQQLQRQFDEEQRLMKINQQQRSSPQCNTHSSQSNSSVDKIKCCNPSCGIVLRRPPGDIKAVWCAVCQSVTRLS
eukprot:Nk52_evm61s217 gene=Nk52_evmTU61s217